MDSSFSLARRCSAKSSVLAPSSCLSISSLSSTDMTTRGWTVEQQNKNMTE